MKPPVVRAQMLIRRPAHEVFNAFIDPAVTTKFWFTRSSGMLKPGAKVQWDWEMYGVSARVNVKEVVPDSRILIEWDEPPVPVEWQFEPRGKDATLVRISNSGFTGTNDEIVAKALDSMGGFTTLLADLKAYLEHGIRLNLVADHHPDGHVKAPTRPATDKSG